MVPCWLFCNSQHSLTRRARLLSHNVTRLIRDTFSGGPGLYIERQCASCIAPRSLEVSAPSTSISGLAQDCPFHQNILDHTRRYNHTPQFSQGPPHCHQHGLVAESLGLSLNLRALHRATETCRAIYPKAIHGGIKLNASTFKVLGGSTRAKYMTYPNTTFIQSLKGTKIECI